jgi:hypothetical protein
MSAQTLDDLLVPLEARYEELLVQNPDIADALHRGAGRPLDVLRRLVRSGIEVGPEDLGRYAKMLEDTRIFLQDPELIRVIERLATEGGSAQLPGVTLRTRKYEP